MADTKNVKCVIVGAGLMGHGIAYKLAKAGHPVCLFDTNDEALQSLPERLNQIAELFGDDGAHLDLVQACSSLAQAADGAQFAIEAATENLAIKRSIVSDLESSMSGDAIITSNTSAIPITRIAQAAKNPQRIVGTHFWNPPHLVKLVEVTQTEQVSMATIESAMSLLKAAGYFPVHVKKDIPGFIGNRLQHALKREAIALVASGVCDAQTLDDVVKHGFGSRLGVLGPMEQSDLVGLDLTEAIHDTLLCDLDNTPGPHDYLHELVEQGHLGMRTGQGLRQWTPESADEVRARLNQFLLAQSTIERD